MVYPPLANRLSCKHLPLSRGRLGLGIAHGFTLVEFVLVAAISVIVLMVAATLSVNEARTAIRTYVYQSLRDQVARVTFLIEGEVAEASELSSTRAAASDCPQPTASRVFLFTFKHSYTQSQAGGSSYICYYRDNLTPPSLYRYGPKFDDQTGALLHPTVAPPSLRLVSPRTALTDITVDQGLLEYNIKIGIDASGSGSIWDLSYSPSSKQVARIGTACMPISSTSSAGCW
jgi:hypothetical protein